MAERYARLAEICRNVLCDYAAECTQDITLKIPEDLRTDVSGGTLSLIPKSRKKALGLLRSKENDIDLDLHIGHTPTRWTLEAGEATQNNLPLYLTNEADDVGELLALLPASSTMEVFQRSAEGHQRGAWLKIEATIAVYIGIPPSDGSNRRAAPLGKRSAAERNLAGLKELAPDYGPRLLTTCVARETGDSASSPPGMHLAFIVQERLEGAILNEALMEKLGGPDVCKKLFFSLLQDVRKNKKILMVSQDYRDVLWTGTTAKDAACRFRIVRDWQFGYRESGSPSEFPNNDNLLPKDADQAWSWWKFSQFRVPDVETTQLGKSADYLFKVQRNV